MQETVHSLSLIPPRKRLCSLVTQESSLFFKGQNIVTEPTASLAPAAIIEIEGTADIAEGVTLGGSGILSLDSGGYLSIEGAIQSGQQIDFADGTGLISIGNPTAFSGTLGFTPVGGARMDFPGIQAQSVGVDLSGTVHTHALCRTKSDGRTPCSA